MKPSYAISNSLLVLSLLLGLAILGGCGGRLGDFTFLTTKQFNLPVNSMEKRARVTGEDCANHFLFFRVGHIQPNTKEAIDQAIEKEDANALIDAVVEWSWFDFILFGSNCIKVEGTAVKIQ